MDTTLMVLVLLSSLPLTATFLPANFRPLASSDNAGEQTSREALVEAWA